MKLPNVAEPVLALITAVKDLGTHSWHEVVYYNGIGWRSFTGSDTFNDGEIVTHLVYAKDAINNSLTTDAPDTTCGQSLR